MLIRPARENAEPRESGSPQRCRSSSRRQRRRWRLRRRRRCSSAPPSLAKHLRAALDVKSERARTDPDEDPGSRQPPPPPQRRFWNRVLLHLRRDPRREALAYLAFSLPDLVDTDSGGSQTGSPSGPWVAASTTLFSARVAICDDGDSGTIIDAWTMDDVVAVRSLLLMMMMKMMMLLPLPLAVASHSGKFCARWLLRAKREER